MFRRIAPPLAFALALSASAALPPGATTGNGDEGFLRNASIRVERHRFASPGGPETFEVLALSTQQRARLQKLLLQAFRRNRAEEVAAARTGRASDGVPGCVSFDNRLTLERGTQSETAWLHRCAGWVAGGPLVGQVVLNRSETKALEEVLGPCAPPCP